MRELVGRHDQVERCWTFPLTKAGKPRKRGECEYAWFTPLLTCQLCGFFSTPRNVRDRDDCYQYDHRPDHQRDQLRFNYEMKVGNWGTPTLCTGCWNKVRAIIRRVDELRDLHTLVRKLQRCA